MGKGTKSIAFYLMMILVFGSLMYFIVKEGESQQVGTAVQTMQNAPKTMGEGFLVFWDSLLITSNRRWESSFCKSLPY